MKSFFITGTDTDVGKTFVTAALLELAKSKDLHTAALKPIAAGCEFYDGTLMNSDALILQKAMTANLAYTSVNPIALEPAIAPHIAADQVKENLVADDICGLCLPVLKGEYDLVVIEGAGGWRVPLNETETIADLALRFNFPVILVVGFRLGCINHALLTIEAIKADGLSIAGWVANQVDEDMFMVEENLSTLKNRIDAPFLGHIPFISKNSEINAASFLDIDKLMA